MRFYATQVFLGDDGIKENNILMFDNLKNRNRYIDATISEPISAKDAKNLMIADVWRTYTSNKADCVFHKARYLP